MKKCGKSVQEKKSFTQYNCPANILHQCVTNPAVGSISDLCIWAGSEHYVRCTTAQQFESMKITNQLAT